MRREPQVAGQFYPAEPAALRQMISRFLKKENGSAPALGLVAPHAGYIYSGAIAGLTFSRVEVPERVVILGPNHHAVGHPAALFPEGSWLTPLGEVGIDEALAEEILRQCPQIARDALAHRYEHSLEVQLPFIQVLAPRAKIVPICLGHWSVEDLLSIGKGLGRALASAGQPTLIVASSDMTHYEPAEVAKRKDQQALARVLALDPEGLWQTVRGERISMCGVVPVTVMLAAARCLGGRTAALAGYANSGDVSGDRTAVVGYAGVIVQ